MDPSETIQPILALSLSDLSPYTGAIIPIVVSAFVYLLTFAFTMGNSAYYRIPTQYGIASLPMAICQVIVAIFSLFVALSAAMVAGSSAVATVMLLIAFTVGMAVIRELHGEASTIERGAIVLGIALFVFAAIVNLGVLSLPFSNSEVELFGLRFTIAGLVSMAIAMIVMFFEAGYIAAKRKRFYLVNPENGEILLAEYSGDRFFFGYLSEVEYVEGDEIPTGRLSGECSFCGGKNASGKYVWCEFRRVVMQRGNIRLSSMSEHTCEQNSAGLAEESG